MQKNINKNLNELIEKIRAFFIEQNTIFNCNLISFLNEISSVFPLSKIHVNELLSIFENCEFIEKQRDLKLSAKNYMNKLRIQLRD